MTAGSLGVRGAVVSGTALFCALFALFVASASWLMVILILGAAITIPVCLYSPAIALLGWLTLGPTVGGLIPHLIAGLPAITPDRVLLIGAGLVVLVRWARDPQSLLPFGRIEFAMAAFLVVAAVSLVLRGGTWITPSEGGLRNDVVNLIVPYAIPFFAFFVAKNVLREERHLRWLLATLVGLGVLLSVIGIVEYATGVTLFRPVRYDADTNKRTTATLGGAFEFGMVLTASLFAAFPMLLRRRLGAGRRALLLAAMGPISISIYLARTRSVWVGVAIGLVIMAFYERRLRRPLATVAVLGVVAGALVWSFLPGSTEVARRAFDLPPIYNRISLTATSLSMVAENPVFGAGYGRYTFIEDKWPHISGFGGVPGYYAIDVGVPHNEFLHVLILVGIVGFTPYAALFWFGWSTARRVLLSPHAVSETLRGTALLLLGLYGMYVMNGLVHDMMGGSQPSNQLYMLLGAVEGARLRSASAGRGSREAKS